jgi:hypothetical protein
MSSLDGPQTTFYEYHNNDNSVSRGIANIINISLVAFLCGKVQHVQVRLEESKIHGLKEGHCSELQETQLWPS